MGIGIPLCCPLLEVNHRGLAAGALSGLLFSTEQTLPIFPAFVEAPDGTHYLSGYLKYEYLMASVHRSRWGHFYAPDVSANSACWQRSPVSVHHCVPTSDLQLTFVIAGKNCRVL